MKGNKLNQTLTPENLIGAQTSDGKNLILTQEEVEIGAMRDRLSKKRKLIGNPKT